ncbi:helix-turn-helix transcriptional regulator [Pseudodonghicola xiamenensis]|uniref:DNA-binding protein n=1 Tax=Pseudodonghicola xiamenensis TaxID=337702 RepID=A0A8J3ME59_9RHOB|nr:helix-turn-helix transcriptional regulator [Pseudodonghicola xiamenensis]GHG96010.1 DNA-binding protein [Pseudodonghicola xiamenensis]
MENQENPLLDQLDQIARGVAETFAPFCEVVLHDLTDPDHAIVAIYNNLSQRQVGDPATELGLNRIADKDFPQVLAAYANQFRDGRRVKSTSIGIRDAGGDYVAALCINVNMTLFDNLRSAFDEFCRTGPHQAPIESLNPASAAALRAAIERFAAQRAKTPRSLDPSERKLLIRELEEAGFLDVRRAIETVSAQLGVSRSTVYEDRRAADNA